MIREALEFIRAQAVAAAGPHLAAYDPAKEYVAVKPDGTIDRMHSVPAWRDHKAYDLDTVCAFAMDRTDTAAIWYSRSAVVCLLVDSDRRHKVTMELHVSPQFAALAALEKSGGKFDQRGLILQLRTTFKDCLQLHQTLIDSLRKIQWKVGQDGESTVTRGKSSIGNSLRAEMSGIDTLPEYVKLTIPVFDRGSLAHVRSTVECVLDPDESDQTFTFRPLAGQMEVAATAGETALFKLLTDRCGDKEVPIYYGQP